MKRGADGAIRKAIAAHSIKGNRSPRLVRFWQIINMNVGFFGIQFGFGLQQGNMSPIYKYLGANDATLPMLWLAGPVTGLLIQPLIGSLSDGTTSRFGRRTPYFVVGALICGLCLIAMPQSGTLWMASGLLWMLNIGANVAMEPYRAFVNDMLAPEQRSLGYLVQSAFTGLSQTVAYLLPSVLVMLGLNANHMNARGLPLMVEIAFIVGGFVSVLSVTWSVWKVPEPAVEKTANPTSKHSPMSLFGALLDVADATARMPDAVKKLALMMFFQWYAMFCYWQYIALSIEQTLFGTTNAKDPGFVEAVLLSGRIGGFYNFVAFLSAFAMLPMVRRYGPGRIHALCLLLGGIGVCMVPSIRQPWLLLLPMTGLGFAWASMMGNPYAMLASSIPPERTGVYLGIFNAFIVLPMMLEVITVRWLYPALGGDPRHIVMLAGGALCLASVIAVRIRITPLPAELSRAK